MLKAVDVVVALLVVIYQYNAICYIKCDVEVNNYRKR